MTFLAVLMADLTASGGSPAEQRQLRGHMFQSSTIYSTLSHREDHKLAAFGELNVAKLFSVFEDSNTPGLSVSKTYLLALHP